MQAEKLSVAFCYSGTSGMVENIIVTSKQVFL